MCGIAGIISLDPSMVTVDRLKLMTDSIEHRGPDGHGHWISNSGNVGLGHRRLSIIDLSTHGAQPMHFAESRYSITFNGEIYNYLEIKKYLLSKGYVFTSASDTEVLLALFDLKREKCLEDLDGMFAFVIYDKKEHTVFCARDRFGEKPFFYAHKPGEYFFFGSEMKALWAGGIPKDINNTMLYHYISYGILENANDKGETFYNGIRRLENAHYMYVNLENLTIQKSSYWDIDILNVDDNISITQASSKFQELFYNSVKRRLRSDVPVGSSLSGGLDSSLVVCVIDELIKGTSIKQKTFSARFPGFHKDEGSYMEMVVKKTGADAFYTYPNDAGLIEKLNKIAYHQEEPVGSASICVQYDVMKLAKDNGVIVLLDGQGADEILAGYHNYYNPYFQELRLKDKSQYHIEIANYSKLHPNGHVNTSIAADLKKHIWNAFPALLEPYFKIKNNVREFINPIFNQDFRTHFSDSSYLENNLISSNNSLSASLYNSTMVKGLSELLRYADRNSMAHSREVRLPFLSHELVEFLFTLPAGYKIHRGWTKYIMRKSFENILPSKITWRKDKIGFEPPQKSWMDSSSVKDVIQNRKELLVKKNILNKKVLEQQPMSGAANDLGDNNWQYWMAGNLFSPL